MARYDSISEILKALEAESKARGNPPSLPANLPAVEALWQAAQSARSQNHFDEAAILCQKLLKFCPDHVPAMQLAAALQVAYQQAQAIYDHIAATLDSGDLIELKQLANRAEAIYPGHMASAVVMSALNGRLEQYAELLRLGHEADLREETAVAIFYFESALERNPGNQDVPKMIHLLQLKLSMGSQRCNRDESIGYVALPEQRVETVRLPAPPHSVTSVRDSECDEEQEPHWFLRLQWLWWLSQLIAMIAGILGVIAYVVWFFLHRNP